MVEMSPNTRRCWICQYYGAYGRGHIHQKSKHRLILKTLQHLLDKTPYGYKNNRYNLANKEIHLKFLKEYSNPKKLMNYNAFDQKFMKDKYRYYFILASEIKMKLKAKQCVSKKHKDKLDRYKQYLALRSDESVKPTDDYDTSSVVDDIPAANQTNDGVKKTK